MSLSCAAQQLTKENATHWAKGKIANNIRQCSCFYLLSLPKEKYLYIVYKVVCLCYIPSKQCFEEMRFFKEVQFSLQSIHFNQKVVVIYKLGVAFELVKCVLFQEEIFLWSLDVSNEPYYVLSTMYCVLKYSIHVFFLYHLSW